MTLEELRPSLRRVAIKIATDPRTNKELAFDLDMPLGVFKAYSSMAYALLGIKRGRSELIMRFHAELTKESK